MKNEQDQNSIIICKTCGADYSADLPNCPYCGTMNLPAAESEYMNKLEHVRENLEGLGGLGGREVKRGFRSMRKKVLLAVVLLILATGVIYGIHLHRARAETRKEREEYLWQREAYAQMDEYYNAGDYESLLAFYLDAQDAGHHLWQYQHSEFCDYLLVLESARETLREYEDGDDDPAWLLQQELFLYKLEYYGRLGEEERAQLAELREPLLEDLDARFQLTEEELAGFKAALARDEYITYDECRQFLEERGTEN